MSLEILVMNDKVQQQQKSSKSVQIKKFFERARERFSAFVRVLLGLVM